MTETFVFARCKFYFSHAFKAPGLPVIECCECGKFFFDKNQRFHTYATTHHFFIAALLSIDAAIRKTCVPFKQHIPTLCQFTILTWPLSYVTAITLPKHL
ncbi:hypothetical protein [Pseudochrobactrum asaccharolyticum]|uniref:hypothetical protein n=1 Tax=Pseudochrobactrum asaccharolyticum TaxID=354351 RepID=UPI0011BFAE7D|nr:hypothetical protein [Pseudochrobactrum asaccharolyticum]